MPYVGHCLGRPFDHCERGFRLTCGLYLLGFSAKAELMAMGRLLVRQQHLEVRISARAAGDSTLLVVAGDLLYRSLPHRLMDTLACTVRVFGCLSIEQVCSCFPGCWLHAEMRWSSLVRGLPTWQRGF